MPAPWVCRNALDRSRKASGLPHICQHDTRHLHASRLLAEGLPLPAVSARLGPGSPAITAAFYSHTLRALKDVGPLSQQEKEYLVANESPAEELLVDGAPLFRQEEAGSVEAQPDVLIDLAKRG